MGKAAESSIKSNQSRKGIIGCNVNKHRCEASKHALDPGIEASTPYGFIPLNPAAKRSKRVEDISKYERVNYGFSQSYPTLRISKFT